MTALIKFIIATILSITFVSCNFDINLNSDVRGNGNIVSKDRNINIPLTSIKATKKV